MGRAMDRFPAETALFTALAVAVGACGSGAPEPPSQVLDSRVREPAIEVDGSRKDWEGNLTRVGDRDVFAGFHRQGDELYVALVSQDPGFDARVFAAGLTLWVDTAAVRGRRYGVRFPVFDAEARKRLRADSVPASPDRARMLRAAGSRYVLVRDGAEEERPGSEEGGVRVAAAIDRGLFTYELRLPLGADAGGPGIPAGDTVSVGLLAGGEQGRGGRDTAAAPPDTAAGGGGRGAGRRLPASGDIPPLEIWVRVALDGQGRAEPARTGRPGPDRGPGFQ